MAIDDNYYIDPTTGQALPLSDKEKMERENAAYEATRQEPSKFLEGSMPEGYDPNLYNEQSSFWGEPQVQVPLQAPEFNGIPEVVVPFSVPAPNPLPIAQPEQPPMVEQEPSELKKLLDRSLAVSKKVPPKEEAKAEPSKEDKKEEPKTDDELLKAQKEREAELKRYQLRSGISNLTAGLFGVNPAQYEQATAPTEAMKMGLKAADLKVSDIKDKREEARKAIKDEAELIELSQTKEFSDPSSSISKAYRETALRIYPALKDNPATANATAAQIKGIFPMLKDQLDTEARKEERRIMANAKAEQKEENQTIKDADKFSELVDPSRPRNGNFGKWQQSQVKADQILNLINSKPPKDIDAVTMYEAARSYESLLSGGVGTVTGALHMIPANIRSDSEKVKAYIQGKLPKAKQEQLVRSIADNVEKQKELFTKEIRNTLKLRLSAGPGKRFIEKNPEEAEIFLKDNYGIDKSFKPIQNEAGKESGLNKMAVPPSDSVRVKSPSGQIKNIPRDRLDDALKAGGELVE